MFNTKQGIFGPGGHGGGIFQTTVNGLGSFNTKQGIFGPGGHGGGIFQTTVSGLGTVVTGPRGVYSEATLSTQIEANAVLPRIGRDKITEDGKLGNETCSAISAIIESGSFSGWTMPAACSSGGSSASIVSAPITSDAYEFKPPMSTGTKIAIAGAGVLLVVGGYVAWNRMRG